MYPLKRHHLQIGHAVTKSDAPWNRRRPTNFGTNVGISLGAHSHSIVLPAVVGALGAISGLLSTTVWPLLGLGLFAPGLSFGILLAAYLRLAADIRSLAKLGSIVVVSIGAYYAAILASLFVPPVLFDDWGPTHGPVLGQFLNGGLVGGTIVSGTFAGILPRCTVRRAIGEVLAGGAAGGALGAAGGALELALQETLGFRQIALTTCWQAGMAFMFALVAERRLAEHRAAASEAVARTVAPTFGNALIGVTVGLMGVMGAWEVHRHVEGKKWLARWEQENAKSVAEAPSGENLPLLEAMPPSRVLLIQRIGQYSPQSRGSVKVEPATATSSRPNMAPTPEHLLYFASYEPDASASIWQFPTTQWAEYQMRWFSGATPLTLEGQYLLVSGDEYYWYSGDMVIRVSQGTGTEVVAAYLARYPSAIAASSPFLQPKKSG